MSNISRFLQGQINTRQLGQSEIDEARKVFRNSIQYQAVFIKPHDGGAMTLGFHSQEIGWYYVIFWSPQVYSEGALALGDGIKETFIHEMTHVWQGQHGTYPVEYMIRSFGSQLRDGVRDIRERGLRELVRRIRERGPIGAWHTYRGRAYAFSMNDVGKNFNEFNVEQQASLIESWYAGNRHPNHLGENIPGADRSTLDSRYPYIVHNIRAGAPNNVYVALQPLGQGADTEIKRIQDKLVELAYLEERRADGYMGRYTRDAVREFQRRNGLGVDGDIGGPNSETRIRLRLPVSQLVPAR